MLKCQEKSQGSVLFIVTLYNLLLYSMQDEVCNYDSAVVDYSLHHCLWRT